MHDETNEQLTARLAEYQEMIDNILLERGRYYKALSDIMLHPSVLYPTSKEFVAIGAIARKAMGKE